jgi:hypothetical protein
MLNCIGDVHLPTINSGRFQTFIQQQPGWPDKRPSVLIFTISRLLSYQKQGGAHPAFTEDDLGCPLI